MKLTSREKKLVYILAASIFAVMFFNFIYVPVSSFRDKLKERAYTPDSGAHRLEEIYSQLSVIRAKKQKYDTILQNSPENVLSVIQAKASENGIKDNVVNVRSTPSNIQNKFRKTSTDFKIEGAPAQSIIKFIHDLDSSAGFIVIESLTITKAVKSSDRYDAFCRLSTFSAEQK